MWRPCRSENRIPSGAKAHTLPPQAAEAAKLGSTGFESWGIIFDPVVNVAMDDTRTLGTNSEYLVEKIGSLPADAVADVTITIRDEVGEENLRFSNTGPQSRAVTDYSRIMGSSINERRLEPTPRQTDPQDSIAARHPLNQKNTAFTARHPTRPRPIFL